MYPFDLICLDCKTQYEGCYNNQPCPNCDVNKNIRWILKREFYNHKDFKNPHIVTIENMKIKITAELRTTANVRFRWLKAIFTQISKLTW